MVCQKKRYDQLLVIWNPMFPYQITGRFPDLPLNIWLYLPDFPVIMLTHTEPYSLLTVTRSYRFLTCFPFNLMNNAIGTCYLLYSIFYIVSYFLTNYNTFGLFLTKYIGQSAHLCCFCCRIFCCKDS